MDKSQLQTFDVVQTDNHYSLVLIKHGVFALLDQISSTLIRALQDWNNVHIKAVVQSSTLSQIRLNKKATHIFDLSLNVYGPETEAEEVGNRLSLLSGYLQHPYFLEPGYEYWNPQCFTILGTTTKYLTHLVGMSESDMSSKRLSDEVEGILGALTVHQACRRLQ
jgi:hypothetical protein